MKIIIYPIKQNHLHTYLYFEKGRDIYLNKNKKQKRKKKKTKKKKTKKKKEKNKKEKRKKQKRKKKTNTFFIQIDKKNAL